MSNRYLLSIKIKCAKNW